MAEMKRTTHPKKTAGTGHPPLVAKPNDARAAEAQAEVEALAAMGGGELAYIRAFRAADLPISRICRPASFRRKPSYQDRWATG